MRSWRVVLVCALVAFLATASAQDAAQCKKDGDAEGAKIASQLCTTKKVSGGARPACGQLSWTSAADATLLMLGHQICSTTQRTA
jgi:hypothetical protein